MRIVIDICVANDPTAHHWLDRILFRIEDGWHVWDLTGTPDADAIEATRWAADRGRQGDRLRELLVASTPARRVANGSACAAPASDCGSCCAG